VQNIARLVVVLVTICLVASGSLAFVNSLTAERIRINEEEETQRLYGEALAGLGKTVELSEPRQLGNLTCYEGSVNGDPVGTAFIVTTSKGYGPPIEIIMAVDASGDRLAGIRIKKHQETPGLGANIVKVRPGEDEPWFLRQFKDLTSDRILLKPAGEIDAITAATISSRAVVDAVREGLEEFARARSEPAGVQ
jgi:electron transport complex protein RnfG